MDRRRFLATGAAASVAMTLPGRRAWATQQRASHIAPHLALHRTSGDALPPFGDATLPDDTSLIHTALDAARAAGAPYADVQRRHVQAERWMYNNLSSLVHESGLTVRVFANGCWGSATIGSIGTVDEAARLGRDAAQRALIAAARRSSNAPRSTLAPLATPVLGSWVMPGIDPFTVTFEEKSNFASAIERFTHQIPIGTGARAMSMLFRRERRVFGSSDGAFTTQIVYLVDARFDYMSRPNHKLGTAIISAPFVTPTGAGWEYIRDIPARAEAEEMLDFAMRAREEREADVGRYDLVLDPISTANFMAASVGPATELTRAMGYYANTEGTSYLTDPLTMLRDGTRVASPLVTVTTDRSRPRGAATVRWDDEGVTPAETAIVTHGILSGFQTTRESAAWISDTARSTGCAGTFGATMPTSQVSPNMTIAPGNDNIALLDLVKNVKKGILVYGATFSSDHQFVSGTSRNAGAMFEIKNGVVGSALSNAKLLYRSPEFWSHVEAIGGPASARLVGIETRRGESTTGSAYHTINAVPMLITGAAVTNEWRPKE